jgi:hypothetical protein
MPRRIPSGGRVALYENHGLNERDLQIANDLCEKHYGKIVRKLEALKSRKP